MTKDLQIRQRHRSAHVHSHFERFALVCLFFAAFIAVFIMPVKAAPAIFVPLGLFDGPRSRGHDISADGSVVLATTYRPAIGTYRLVRWTAAGSALGSETQDFASQSRVALSSDGSTAVGTRPSGGSGNSVAFRWNNDGSVDLLGEAPLPPNDIGSIARDVSSDGTTVVGSMGTLSGSPEAFRWTEATGMVGLGGLPGAEVWSSARGVSADRSVIVGQAHGLTLPPHDNHAFRWTADTGMVVLPRPANATFAAANRVSADGSVIIGRMDLSPPPGPSGESQDVAFRWTPATGMVSLGDLPGGSVNSDAFDVSADGSVIVGAGETSANPSGSPINEAFYWTDGGGMFNLRDVLNSFGATNLDGWLLTEARGVSADGFTVVGTAVDPSGVSQAFVATIPEPSTITLAVFATVAILVTAVRNTRYSNTTRKDSLTCAS